MGVDLESEGPVEVEGASGEAVAAATWLENALREAEGSSGGGGTKVGHSGNACANTDVAASVCDGVPSRRETNESVMETVQL